MINSNYIKSFLNFGYDVNFRPKMSFNYSTIKNLDHYTYAKAKNIFLESLQDITRGYFGKLVVPLSGGLDSRLILAGLLELYPADKIDTYTYGTPGTYDFDIGVNVARSLGVKNKKYDLSKYKYTHDNLNFSSNLFSNNTLLFYQPPYDLILEDFSGSKFVIGFMGDPIAGSHFDNRESNIEIDIYNRFIKKNQFVKSTKLIDFDPQVIIDRYNFESIKSYNISKTEYLDFEIRQLKYIQPHVMPLSIDACSPFINGKMFDFFMGLDSSDRVNQSFYNRFLLDSYSREFNLGCKNNLGLALNSSGLQLKFWSVLHRLNFLRNRTLNYRDFNKLITTDTDMHKLVAGLISDFENRNINLNVSPTSLFKRHCSSEPQFADALIAISSLEVNMRNSKV